MPYKHDDVCVMATHHLAFFLLASQFMMDTIVYGSMIQERGLRFFPADASQGVHTFFYLAKEVKPVFYRVLSALCLPSEILRLYC